MSHAALDRMPAGIVSPLTSAPCKSSKGASIPRSATAPPSILRPSRRRPHEAMRPCQFRDLFTGQQGDLKCPPKFPRVSSSTPRPVCRCPRLREPSNGKRPVPYPEPAFADDCRKPGPGLESLGSWFRVPRAAFFAALTLRHTDNRSGHRPNTELPKSRITL